MLCLFVWPYPIISLLDNYIFMAHNNDHPMASSHAEGIQGNTHGVISIESYVLQIQRFLNSTLNEISELQQSHGALEVRFISMQQDSNRLNDVKVNHHLSSSRLR